MGTPATLAEAVLQVLRTAPLASLFGDTWDGTAQTGVKKFEFDWISPADLPYCVVGEPQEVRRYMTSGNGVTPYIADGSLVLAVTAADRDQSKALARAVGAAFRGARLSWIGGTSEGRTDMIAVQSQGSQAISSSAEGSPVVFQTVLQIGYQAQGYE